MGRNKDDNWTKNFKLLKKYKEEFGNCNVPNGYRYKGFGLGAWVGTQRLANKENNTVTKKLNQDQIDKLNSIGFIWDPLEYQWNEKFELLKQYKEEFGNCYLPLKLRYKKVNLGHWANTQRQAYKGNDKYTITQERIDKLNSIGFIWDPLEYQWNEKFELLKQYKEEFGDCNVPTKFIYKREALGTWVGRQRKKLNSIKNKNDLLKEDIEKINKLESIGFIWKKIK